MSLPEELRSFRHKLFHDIEKARSPQSLYKVQLVIADEIRKAEAAAKRDESGQYKNHIKILRAYGDALAWKLLSAFTIRQLSRVPSPPPSLLSQGKSFEITLETGQEYADGGIPVLLSDITNCLKMGDLVICNNPDLPIVVECKTKRRPPSLITRGRSGRQLSRILGTLSYLQNGRAKVYGDPELRIVVETNEDIEYTWDMVNQSVRHALKSGSGFGMSSHSDVVWAFTDKQTDPEPPKEILQLVGGFEMPVFGCHAEPLDEKNPLIPPPMAWPIDADGRFALMESEVLLFHFIDLHQFTTVVTDYGRIAEIRETKTSLDKFCFLVEIDGQLEAVSSRFLDDVIYGFQTIESTVGLMIQFVRKSMQIDLDSVEAEVGPARRPEMLFVNTVEEALRLVREPVSDPRQYLVSMPITLFLELSKTKRAKLPAIFDYYRQRARC